MDCKIVRKWNLKRWERSFYSCLQRSRTGSSAGGSGFLYEAVLTSKLEFG